jgi:hypothetical protein
MSVGAAASRQSASCVVLSRSPRSSVAAVLVRRDRASLPPNAFACAKKRAGRLPLSGPPIAFLLTPILHRYAGEKVNSDVPLRKHSPRRVPAARAEFDAIFRRRRTCCALAASRGKNHAPASGAGFFFGRGSTHRRKSNSARFFMLVRCNPSAAAASLNGEATALRSL